MIAAYYNEFEPYAAQWLRNLIAKNLICPGVVDERSIVDVRPDDLRPFVQVHLFAGIGGWSLAARLAAWPDDRPLWTGSEPCQPYSVAGKGLGDKDARFLRPEVHRLVSACRPDVYVGEQVAAAAGRDWLDRVHSDMESIGYACRAVVVPACAVDAPHRRDRLWFVADRDSGGQPERSERNGGPRTGERQASCRLDAERLGVRSGAPDALADACGGGVWVKPGRLGGARRTSSGLDRDDRPSDAMAHPDDAERRPIEPARHVAYGSATGRVQGDRDASERGAGVVEYAESGRRREPGDVDGTQRGACGEPIERRVGGSSIGPGAWSGAGWLDGADGKARRVEPSTRLLAHGVPARVGKLRAYGNAIVPQVAAEVLKAYMDCRP